MTNSTSSDTLYSALCAINEDCDGARKEDGVGFNKYDRDDADHYLAIYSGPKSWSEDDRYAIWGMLRKYRRQLIDNHGIEFDSLSALAPEVIERDKEVFGERH